MLVLWGAVLLLTVAYYHVPGFAGLLLRGCVCVLLPGILYWILYRHSEEWKGAEPLLRRLLARHA